MSYTSVITEAWKLFKDGKKYLLYYFGSIFALIVIVGIGMVLLFVIGGASAALSSSSSLTENPSAIFGSIGILTIFLSCLLYLVYVLLIGAIDSGVYKGYAVKYKTDNMISFSEIIKKGLKYFVKYIAASLVIVIPLIVLIVIISFLGGLVIGAINNTDTAMIVSFLISCLTFLIYIPVSLLLSAYFVTLKNAIIIDEKGIIEAITYSFSFVKRHLGKLLGVILVFILLSCLLLLPYFCLYFGASLFQVGGSFTQDINGDYSANTLGSSFFMLLIGYCLQIIGTIYIVIYAMYANAYMIVAYVKIAKLDKKEDVKISEPVMANA